MNKMIRRLSLLLALVLCLSAGCAGVSAAETATAEEAAGMEFFMAMMQAIPGMDQIDWAGFAADFEANGPAEPKSPWRTAFRRAPGPRSGNCSSWMKTDRFRKTCP